MRPRLLLVLAAIMFCAVNISFAQAGSCSPNWHVLTNGTTADANQVMDNFNCILSNPLFSGSVGIGVSPTAFTLQLSSAGSNLADFDSTSAAGGNIVVSNSGNALGYFGSSASLTGGALNDLAIRASLGNIIIAMGATEVSRWGTDGSFLVGDSTNGGWAGNAGFESKVTGAGRAAVSAWDAGTTSGAAILVRVDNTTVPLVDFRYSGGQVGSITYDGTHTLYNATSDERLKNWHVPQRDHSGAIRKLWVGDFNWKNGNSPDFGYRAQQAFPLIPGVVHRPSQPSGQWQMDYGKTAPLAMWGVKDLYRITDGENRRIETTGNDVKALARQVAELRRANESRAAQITQLKAANDNYAIQIAAMHTQMSALEREVNIRTAQK